MAVWKKITGTDDTSLALIVIDGFQDVGKLAYKVVSDEDGAACILCQGSETGSVYPEEVSAQVINKLMEASNDFTGVMVDRAVISVPAYFDEEQQEATVAAGVQLPPRPVHNRVK